MWPSKQVYFAGKFTILMALKFDACLQLNSGALITFPILTLILNKIKIINGRFPSPSLKLKKIEKLEGRRCLSSVVILLSSDIAAEGTTLKYLVMTLYHLIQILDFFYYFQFFV